MRQASTNGGVMRIWGLALSALLAAILTASAAGSSLASDPAGMVLSKKDFPDKGVRYTWGDAPANVIQGLKGLGITARGAYFAGTIPVTSTKSQVVSGAVYTTLSAGEARKAYAAFNSDNGGGSRLALPPYGDEQIVLYKPGSSVANMLVRRNAVIWQLTVEGMGLLVIPKAQMIAELKKYAAKLKAHVGGG